jgi:hypothetical protein
MKYEPVRILPPGAPGRLPHYHAECIAAARAGNSGGICSACCAEASADMPPQRSVTAKYERIATRIALYNPDGSINLGQCLDDGGVFDPRA